MDLPGISASELETDAFVESLSNSTVEVSVNLEAAAGQTLAGGRFILRNFIESRPLRSRPSDSDSDEVKTRAAATPGQSFPSISGYSEPRHLGQGNFGDVWEAYDTQLNKRVAVKIFYSKRTGVKKYLTWTSASSSEQADLKTNVEECALAQELMKHAHIYPVGANRICQCFEEYVMSAKGTSRPVFLVLELCGRSLTNVRTDFTGMSSRDHLPKARNITKQILEAVAYMNMLDPPLIHHDMKLDNAVALEDDGYHVKLIDFGCFVWGKPSNQYSQAIGDRRYMPPEFTGRVAFKLPAYSFDIFSVGLMHMELLCPALEVEDWYSMWSGPPSFSKIYSALQRRCPGLSSTASQDLALIQTLVQSDPAKRPSPMDAMESACFDEEEPTADVLPADQGWSVGEKVEYNSKTLKQWMPCVIAEVHASGTLRLVREDGSPFHDRADPAKVRERDPHGSIAESFRPDLPPMKYEVGAPVEYYSASHRWWFQGYVESVNMQDRTYNIRTSSALMRGVPEHYLRSRSSWWQR